MTFPLPGLLVGRPHPQSPRYPPGMSYTPLQFRIRHCRLEDVYCVVRLPLHSVGVAIQAKAIGKV